MSMFLGPLDTKEDIMSWSRHHHFWLNLGLLSLIALADLPALAQAVGTPGMWISCVHGKRVFNYTGASQTFTLPTGACTTLTFKLWGGGAAQDQKPAVLVQVAEQDLQRPNIWGIQVRPSPWLWLAEVLRPADQAAPVAIMVAPAAAAVGIMAAAVGVDIQACITALSAQPT